MPYIYTDTYKCMNAFTHKYVFEKNKHITRIVLIIREATEHHTKIWVKLIV